jgi:hypothetical protein
MMLLADDSVHQPNVTPSFPIDGVCTQGLLEPTRHVLSSADDDQTPSILREYHYSFLQILFYSIVWTTAVIAFLAFLWIS